MGVEEWKIEYRSVIDYGKGWSYLLLKGIISVDKL